jgi:hypothetical protein
MFVLAATSTMRFRIPTFRAAYPDFWRGAVAFNPILARLGVAGALPAFTVAVVYVVALGWLLRTVLMSRRLPEIP